uniref:[Histone H3]-trimethyl-L-lysine(4) demethylase n=1 Tax=Globisporangium ultimum (strain ATCC 200006 / CBS 805.95 / DAOM BR144) TaxID=431595 RepID=K3WE24_GLOUD
MPSEAAELAYKSEICQTCLRGDCWEQMLLCDSCNGGHHLFCLDNPLDEVPPGDWYCDACVEESYSDERDTNPKFGFEMGSEYNVVAYKEKADAWKRNYFGVKSDAEVEKLTDLELEKEYWRLLSIPVHEQRLEVEYGSDVDTGSVGSGFPRMDTYLKCLRFITKRLKNVTMNGKNDYMRKMSEYFAHGLRDGTESGQSLEALLRNYAHDDWNLNNLPKLPGSVLQHLDEDIKGVMVPWIYMGMCFSTFCWHVEDHNFYSMSYNHCGAPKTWYGVPCGKADHFEETMRKLTPELFGSQPDLHLQLVTMFSPATLIKHGVPVYRATHRPNEFMVTFPSAYHGGFNNGFNCAEAVNFATVDWIPWGAKSVRKYRDFSKLPVFSHDALICSLAETLVETSKFDYETALKFLYPAMAELYDDFVKFEEHVTAHNVTTHEWMAEFEERHHSISASGLPVRANKKRMMSTSGDCGEKEEAAKANNFMRTTKMSMSSSSPQSKLTTRPTRMVLWAGQSGKNEGLRCVTCNQYCYLQAVVCTKCRHHSTVGCVEHYTDMCNCDSSKHYVYLHRYDAPHFKSLVQSMQSRLEQVKEWNEQYDAVFSPKQDDVMGDATSKPTISMLKNLLSSGLKSGGADQDRLDTIELTIQDAMRWTEKAEKLVQHHHTATHEDIQLQAVLDLSAAAEKLVAVPEKLEQVDELLQGWHKCKRAADSLLDAVVVVQQQESNVASSFNIRNPRDSEGLWHESKQHQTTIVSIGDLTTQIDAMGLGCQDDIVARLQHARQYLEVLVSANAVVTIIAKNMQRSRNVSRPWEHTPVQTQTPVTETACRLVVESADNLNLDNGISMFKVEMLRSFLKVTEAETAELQAALNDHSKSTEELEVVLNRLRTLAICPDQLPELSERLEKCKAWEARAKQMIDPTPGTIPNHWLRVQMPLSQQVVVMPTLEEVEAFYGQADAFFVPTTSLLRRQIHGRIQDCRRWYVAVHGLFEKSHNGESGRGLVPFLQAAIAKFHSQYKQKDHPHSRLHCVCQQVLSDKSNTIACHRCHSLFHLQCVDHYPVPGSKAAAHAFVCEDCQPKHHRNVPHQQPNTSYPGSLHLRATLGSQGVPLFCLCRGAEGSSMICCDFCDEWYHSSCIDMSFEVMNQIEAYRCPRCAIKQNLYYLDKKAMRKDYLGRRPAFARLETFLTQLQSSLIALPPGALELIEYIRLVQQIQRSVQSYVQGFASEFVPETFARMNYQVEEQKLMVLMHQVTDLEVSLDGVQANLGAIHWCLRACHMVLGCEHAPKYSHLVVLLDDTKRANFTFPRVEYYHIQMTIEDRVHKASLWLKQVKTLEVEEWNIEKARRLLREYQELRQFLELPVAEVNLVHQTIANGNVDDDFVADKKRRLV